ncbi:hypothetical protein ACOSP7_019049 [Xanthoceras sorbifolium]
MAILSAFLGCFMPSSVTSRVSNNDGRDDLAVKVASPEKSKRKSKSSGSTIVVPYFPTTTQLSRL